MRHTFHGSSSFCPPQNERSLLIPMESLFDSGLKSRRRAGLHPDARPLSAAKLRVANTPMTLPSNARSLWWDRDLDSNGRPIRVDVRSAAHAIWDQACDRVQAVLGDPGEAAGFIESSVAQVSRYLDRLDSAPGANDTARLLMRSFSRALRRYVRKLRRIELVDDLTVFSEAATSPCAATKEDCRLDAEKAARRLSQRGRTMLDLRRVGFEWKEIGQLLNMSDCAARAEFSRELKKAKMKISPARIQPYAPDDCPKRSDTARQE
jgi:DNA-directed RNA polymerase specialized sigma24 family protein